MRQPRNALLLCALYVFFMGCQSAKESSYIAEDINSYRDKRINIITLKNGETYKYDKVGGRYYEEIRDSGFVRKIVGYDLMGTAINFDLNRVLEVQSSVVETDGGGTILTVLLGVAGGILLLGLLLVASFRGHY